MYKKFKFFGRNQSLFNLALIPLLLMCWKLSAQELDYSITKVFLVQKFAQNVKWEDEMNIDTFRIGIFGEDVDLLSNIYMLESLTHKNKPISIVHFTKLNEITRTHLLFVTSDKNSAINRISEIITGNNTLLISDLCKDKNQIMINFLRLKENKPDFEINKANIINENLTILPDLLLIGGTDIDLAELYHESQVSLQNVMRQVSALSDSIRKRNEEITNRNKEIENQKRLISKQENDILIKQEDIKTREEELNALLSEVALQQKTLDSKIELIKKQEDEIDQQMTQIDMNEYEIQRRKKNLIDLEKERTIQLNKQKNELKTYVTQIGRQKIILYTTIPFSFLILCLVFFIHKGYTIKKEANKKLKGMNIKIVERNKEINFQKIEIQGKNMELITQSEELRQSNEEILSINEALENQKKELQLTLESLKQTQSQLVQSEKMASVGQLTAGIAHELNNPINFISGNVKPLIRDIEDIFKILNSYDTVIQKNSLNERFGDVESLKTNLDYSYLVEEINNLLKGIFEGAYRSGQIIKGLRSFSRLDKDEFVLANIHKGIDSTLLLLINMINKRITVHKNYGEIPKIECLPNKLNQVFMNILTNSIQAIENKGDIYINTISSKMGIKICIKDTGKGMTNEVRKRIFEPFYTTKDVGLGIGLGLSITYGIIEQHNGNLDVLSEPSKGTEFIISLPISQSNKK